jgi:putative peptidoglycan lipid II flippase
MMSERRFRLRRHLACATGSWLVQRDSTTSLVPAVRPKGADPERCASDGERRLESAELMSSADIEETRGRLVRSASAITPLTLLSRLTGYLREKIVALFFGATARTDAFIVAWRIPNMLRDIVGEGAMSSAFIPVYAEITETRSSEEARAFVGRAVGTFAFLLSGVTIAGILLSPLLVDLLAHDFRSNPWQFALAVSLNRWIFPYIFLVSMAALFQGILNAHHRFALSAAAPIFMNVGFILATLVLAPRLAEPAYALAAGVLTGGLLQMAVQWPQLSKLRAVGRPALGWRDPAVRSVMLLAAPRLFAYGINTINLTFATRFASELGTSNVSRLYFANRLKELVLGGFAVALATAILPLLSRQALVEDRGEFKATLAFSLRLIAFVTVPATVGLIVLRFPILRVLLQGGAFRAEDTRATGDVLAALSLGLFFFAVVRVVVPAFYALKQTRLPVVAAFVDCAVFVAACFALTPRLGLPGIGLASSLAAAVNVAILLTMLRRREGRLSGREILQSLARITLAALTMGAGLWIALKAVDPMRLREPRAALTLFALIAGGAAIYWSVASLLGAPEPQELRRVTWRKRR